MSNGFRDNHDSLLARVAHLEAEVVSARAGGLDSLERRVEDLTEGRTAPTAATALALADEERALRKRLDRVAAKLARFGGAHSRIGARRRMFLVAVLAAGAYIFVVTALLVAKSGVASKNGGRTLCQGELDALTLERLGGRDCDPLLVVKAEDFPGGLHAVAPTDLVAVARRAPYAGNDRLRAIEVPRVPPNGRVDFRTPAYLGVVSVHLDHHGGVFDFEGMHIGFEGDGDLVPDPHCSVEDVWRAAMRTGVTARADEQATVTYKAVLPRGHAGWIFELAGHTLVVDDATCAVSPDLHVPPPSR